MLREKTGASFVGNPGDDISQFSGGTKIVKPMRIGVAGVEGSFTEMAAKMHCDANGINRFELAYLTATDNVLTSLEAGDIDRAIFAIENSIGGVVKEYLPAILAHRCKFLSTFDFEVEQVLMVNPKVKVGQVTVIVSQGQALAQCQTHLRKNYPDIPQRDYIDTATAARDLRGGKLPRTAAVVGSRTAARLYDLDVLAGPIQDNPENYTTFIVAEPLAE